VSWFQHLPAAPPGGSTRPATNPATDCASRF